MNNKLYFQLIYILLATSFINFTACNWQFKNSAELVKEKGGMILTVEISIPDLVNSMANSPNDSLFKLIMSESIEKKKNKPKDFLEIFKETFYEIAPLENLASYFISVEIPEINYNSTNEEVLKIISDKVKEKVKISVEVLHNRIKNSRIKNSNVQQIDSSSLVLLELPDVKNPERIRKLLLKNVNLEFWETYDNTGLFEYFSNANFKLKELQEDKNNQGKIDTSNLSLIEKVELEDEFIKFEKGNPLFKVLRPNVNNSGQLISGTASVGISNVKDTAKVNSYLNLKAIKETLPKDVKLLWELKPFEPNNEYINLIAIRITNRDGKAPIDGSFITDARVDINYQVGSPQVLLTMNKEGSDLWARMTRANVGKQIAIVINDKVYSYPTVQSEIQGGRSSITGNFSMDEAKDLVNYLKSGSLPTSIKLVKEIIVEPTKQ